MNFRNSDPPAAFKAQRIEDMLEAAGFNNGLGTDLVNGADTNVTDAAQSFENVRDLTESVEANMAEFNARWEDSR